MTNRNYTTLICIIILIMAGNVFASDLGKIDSITDRVIPDGSAGLITRTVKALTGTDGKLAIPLYKDSEILSYETLSGSAVTEPRIVETGDKKYHIIYFREEESLVEFTLDLRVEELYEMDEADLGDTYPSNAFELKYKAVNTAPLDIGSYSAEVAAPMGYELLNIENYSAKKPYSIFKADGFSFGAYNFKGIDAGEQISLTLNVYKTSTMATVLIWVFGILLAVLFMFKNRDLLRKARELKNATPAKG